ncbi:MAG: hypothetical protein FWH36_07365 [Lentimicrobiaceae bacterium]|nr:hypothetical protein [Lentimicrobiaceae bacterium]
MNKITYFWNHIFYNVWKFNSWCPFFIWLFKKKKVQKIYQKRGVQNVQKIHADAMALVMLPFSYHTMLLIVCFLSIPIGIYVFRMLFICNFTTNTYIDVLLFTIVVTAPSCIINEILLRWRKDGYISYFKMFEKESEKEKRKWKWKWITSFTILLMLGIIVIEFIILSKLQPNSLP